MTISVSRGNNAPAVSPTSPRTQATQSAPVANTPPRAALHSRDVFEANNPGLEAINGLQLQAGRPHSCVTTVRANLRRAGLGGLPGTTDQDPNNPRGMMVQMLQSGQWRSMPIPGAQSQSITSPYGTVQAQVLSGEAYLQAARNGQIPEGAVVFQTEKGLDYSGGSRGSDVGIVRNGAIFNYQQMPNMSVYQNRVTDVVVMVPHNNPR
ncbi:hypothetical protein [Archangium violaceum]|uniref:hypothetical protein n=1 Tax=Archangium violaceum TaxID=83451 RepID=UPI0036DB0C1D